MRGYTDITQDPIAIGNERGTDYVLDSTYLVRSGRLKVTAKLHNVKTGAVDVVSKYEDKDTDVYAAGPNVAAQIAHDLLIKLNLAEVDRGTESEEAWLSYLQGMILSNKRTVEDAEIAVDEFNKAIRLDPNYPRAYMGLAHALQTIYTNGGARDKYCEPAYEAEKKALALDPNLGDAMVMMATNRKICWYEIPESEELYKRAIAMDPNSAHVRRFYAVNIASEGRFPEALEHLRIARELEPNNPFNEKLVGRVLFQARRYDEAIESCIKSKDLVPEVEQSSFIYMSYEMKKDYDKAFEWLLFVKREDGENEDELNEWRRIYAESGWHELLKRRLERALEEEKTTDKINKRARLLEEITSLLVELGDYDRAFEYMEKAATSYSLYGGQMLVDPYLDPVRSDPRYKAILAKTWNSHGGDYSVY
jgi:tetratricopeptide (TPR) repeat protein